MGICLEDSPICYIKIEKQFYEEIEVMNHLEADNQERRAKYNEWIFNLNSTLTQQENRVIQEFWILTQEIEIKVSFGEHLSKMILNKLDFVKLSMK